jgi:hypothetical protein
MDSEVEYLDICEDLRSIILFTIHLDLQSLNILKRNQG